MVGGRDGPWRLLRFAALNCCRTCRSTSCCRTRRRVESPLPGVFVAAVGPDRGAPPLRRGVLCAESGVRGFLGSTTVRRASRRLRPTSSGRAGGRPNGLPPASRVLLVMPRNDAESGPSAGINCSIGFTRRSRTWGSRLLILSGCPGASPRFHLATETTGVRYGR